MNPLNILISWSGSLSYQIAEGLANFLGKMFEEKVKCWLSTHIEPSGGWYTSINDALREADFGIICFTLDNADSP